MWIDVEYIREGIKFSYIETIPALVYINKVLFPYQFKRMCIIIKS